MKEFLKRLKEKVDVGIVGGSDLSKQQEQLGDNSEIASFSSHIVTNELTYVFHRTDCRPTQWREVPRDGRKLLPLLT